MIVHEAVCDGPACTRRQAAESQEIGSEAIGARVYRLPVPWIAYQDRTFCQLACLGAWATACAAAVA